MRFSSLTLRRAGLCLIASLAVALPTMPGQAQTLRAQMASKIAADAGHTLVNKISGESCSQFAATMSQMKNSKSQSSSMSSKLKANTQARSEFVDIVAGPLLNKMIDCNMMPGGM